MKDVWGHSGSMDQSLSELEIRHPGLWQEKRRWKVLYF